MQLERFLVDLFLQTIYCTLYVQGLDLSAV